MREDRFNRILIFQPYAYDMNNVSFSKHLSLIMFTVSINRYTKQCKIISVNHMKNSSLHVDLLVKISSV